MKDYFLCWYAGCF